MSDAVLEAYVRSYIAAQPGEVASFAWQGGEPTLAGLPFFEKVVALQARHAGGKRIENAFQTNGTLLNDAWCTFFRKHSFLVGISIDGPQSLHDAYRVDRKGRPTYRDVIRGVELCKKHQVAFNTLTVINAKNVTKPLEVYRFLREIGSEFIQFIPLVERLPDAASDHLGLSLAHPPDLSAGAQFSSKVELTEWSVSPEALGEFYCKIFDRWVSRDVGRVFVQLFDNTLGKWVGAPGGVCVFSETCGRALALEHNGDLYACDHFVYPRYKLGNLMTSEMTDMVESTTMQAFGEAKRSTLPRQCRECEVRFCCNGDCPKHRFGRSSDGEYGISYLCAGLKRFFKHSAPAMREMADLYRQQRSPAEIMRKN